MMLSQPCVSKSVNLVCREIYCSVHNIFRFSGKQILRPVCTQMSSSIASGMVTTRRKWCGWALSRGMHLGLDCRQRPSSGLQGRDANQNRRKFLSNMLLVVSRTLDEDIQCDVKEVFPVFSIPGWTIMRCCAVVNV